MSFKFTGNHALTLPVSSKMKLKENPKVQSEKPPVKASVAWLKSGQNLSGFKPEQNWELTGFKSSLEQLSLPAVQRTNANGVRGHAEGELIRPRSPTICREARVRNIPKFGVYQVRKISYIAKKSTS